MPSLRCSASSSRACKTSRVPPRKRSQRTGLPSFNITSPPVATRVPPAFPHSPALDGRGSAATHRRGRAARSAGGLSQKNRGGTQTALIESPAPGPSIQCFKSGSSTVSASSSPGNHRRGRPRLRPPSPLRRRDLARRTSGSGRTRFLLASTMSRSGRGRTDLPDRQSPIS